MTDEVNKALRPVGIQLVNANISEIEEEKRTGAIGYLEAREKKKLSQAISQSEVDMAEAKKLQDIETMQRRADTRRQVALLEKEATLVENEQRQRIAESLAQLVVIEAESKKREMLAKIESDTSALLRDQELQKAVETAKQERELVKIRAEHLTKTQVHAEQIRIDADAHLYKTNQEAEAKLTVAKKLAEGDYYTMTQEAEGKLTLVKKEVEGKALRYKIDADGTLQLALSKAQGILAKLAAEGKGMKQVAEFSSDPSIVQLYLLLKNGTPVEIAKAQAEGLKNLSPKIWNFSSTNGSGSGSSQNNLNTGALVNDLMKAFPAGLQMLEDYNLLSKKEVQKHVD